MYSPILPFWSFRYLRTVENRFMRGKDIEACTTGLFDGAGDLPRKLHSLLSYLCSMEEGKRQKQIAQLLMVELSNIFQRLGLGMMEGGMVSISSVKVTPDLLEARIYLSLYQVKDAAAAMKKIGDRSWEIKKELTAQVGKQLRRMPVLRFFQDTTLDHVDRMEALFKKLKPD